MCPSDTQLAAEVASLDDVLCQYAKDAAAIQATAESVVLRNDFIVWLSLLQYIAAEPSILSMRSASCAVILMEGVFNILHIAEEDGSRSENLLQPHTLQVILNSMDAVLSYEAFYQFELQTVIAQKELLLNTSGLMLLFCEAITDVNSSASLQESTYESVQSRLRLQPVVICSESTPTPTVYVLYEDESLFIPDLSIGAYCLLSYSLPVYETRMTELLDMQALAIVPGPFVNGTGEIVSGHFVIDVAASNVIENVNIEAFNITCEGNESTSHWVPCLLLSGYSVPCHGVEGAWEFVCPSNVFSNVACHNLAAIAMNHSNSTSIVTEICEVSFVTNSSMICACGHIEQRDYGRRHVRVEVEAFVVFVVSEFAQTWTSVHALRGEDLERGWKILLLIIVVMSVIYLGLWYVDSVDAHYAKEFLLTTKKKNRPLKRFSLRQKQKTAPLCKILQMWTCCFQK